MVAEVLTLPNWEKGVFIGGWKYDRWKQLVTKFGHKFGSAELQAVWSGLAVLAPSDCRPDDPAWGRTVRPPADLVP
jgi:hypothetical protein